VPYRVAGKGRIASGCLSGLWLVLYLTAERVPEILAAQGQWRTWLLRGPPARCLPGAMEAAAQRRRRAGCLHARGRLGARSVIRPVRRGPPLSQGELVG